MNRAHLRDERGQTMIVFAILLPTILILGAALVNIGNWWTHGRHLQTKVDAAVFAGGGVWGFPCGATSDTNATGTGIVDVARRYVGPHTSAAGVVQTTGFNPQIGVVDANDVHVVVNGADWWDDDTSTNPPDFTTPAGSVCQAMILDVKATEANSPPLFGFLGLWPDVKRKARVQIEEVEGIRGLLPISVRVPKPLSTAAVFYNEQTGAIFPDGVKYFREVCQPPPGVTTCLFGVPPGLGQWTTQDASGGNWANFSVAETTGVVIATSFRPACGVPGATPPCFEDAGFATVGSLCNQAGGIVQCFYATGSGASQTVRSGLQFIRGYTDESVTNGPPNLESAWFGPGSCGSVAGSAYFNSVTSSCTATLNATVDLGTAPGRISDNMHTEVRYKLIAGNTSNSDDDPPGPCGNNYQPGCGLSPSWSTTVTLDRAYARHAMAIRVRLAGTTIGSGPGATVCPSAGTFNATCQWFFTSTGRSTSVPTDLNIFLHPVQRSFMGNLDLSGAVKWLRLWTDVNCDGGPFPDYSTDDGRAASLPFGNHCSYVEMGLQGGLARDRSEERRVGKECRL